MPSGMLLQLIYQYLDYSYINCIRSFFTVLDFVGYAVVFLDIIDEAGYVNEKIGSAICGCNETKTLSSVEKFYCAFLH